jgi:alcohol dehydrogenase
MAFSNSSVTLIHGMSRPLGANFHIPHGMCNAMLLPRCTSFSAQGSVDRYAESARVLGLSDARHDDDAAGSLALALQQVTSDLKVPTLQQFGVQEEAFRRAVPKMAADALASGSPANNPIVPSSEELEKLFHELWDHECRAQVN